LPEPTKVYISGATKNDCTDIIEKANSGTKSLWAGNVNTLPGDIILIYGVAPFSQINSIWRAISKGFLDPFSYWFNSQELPEINGPQLLIKTELNVERDIEIYLLEPFLYKLGYTEKNRVRQMPLRMGRGERIYPDYAIKANTNGPMGAHRLTQ
jgi:hypothetical protein